MKRSNGRIVGRLAVTMPTAGSAAVKIQPGAIASVASGQHS